MAIDLTLLDKYKDIAPISGYETLSLANWNKAIVNRGLHIKFHRQLLELKELYQDKIIKLRNLRKQYVNYEIAATPEERAERITGLNEKLSRLVDKYACTLKEIDIRDRSLLPRTPVGTTYYIDLTNGNNARTGLKIGNSTIDSTADTTHFVDDALTGADDYINGSYFYNVTRALGSLITDFVAATDTVTLTTAIAGMTAGDTYYILDSWLTLEKYTTTTARTVGDIAYVRANTTETVGANDIVFDEDGTALSYISIIGCDGATNNPWVEASTVRPIIDFGDAQYQIDLTTDEYWKIANLDIIQSADTAGNIYCNQAHGLYLLNCIIRDNSSATASSKFGISIAVITYNFKIESCQFLDNLYANLKVTGSSGVIDSCIFNGGVATTTIGLLLNNSNVLLKSCSFGQTTAHTSYDITASNSIARLINCIRNKSTYDASGYSLVFSEDDNQVKGANVTYSWRGTVTKSATARDGGASSSAQLLPGSLVGLYAPLSVAPFNQHGFAIYNTSLSEVNVDIYIRADSAWATYPTAAQLYVECSYLSHATLATRATVVSTDLLTDGTTWVRFRCTMTPLQAGYIYVKVYLGLYTATEGILVDILPIVS